MAANTTPTHDLGRPSRGEIQEAETSSFTIRVSPSIHEIASREKSRKNAIGVMNVRNTLSSRIWLSGSERRDCAKKTKKNHRAGNCTAKTTGSVITA